MLGILSLVARASDGNEREIADPCGNDRDCSGFLRCLDRVCAVPPAMLGVSDDRTPTAELASSEESRGRFFVELATTRYEKARGLSYRPSMDGRWGMLFVCGRLAEWFQAQPFRMGNWPV